MLDAGEGGLLQHKTEVQVRCAPEPLGECADGHGSKGEESGEEPGIDAERGEQAAQREERGSKGKHEQQNGCSPENLGGVGSLDVRGSEVSEAEVLCCDES